VNTSAPEGWEIEIPGERILESAEELNLFPGINLEGLYNQDALVYLPEYGIETVKTMIRGRIRYKVKLICVRSIL
jgi:hypothetical protein